MDVMEQKLERRERIDALRIKTQSLFSAGRVACDPPRYGLEHHSPEYQS